MKSLVKKISEKHLKFLGKIHVYELCDF